MQRLQIILGFVVVVVIVGLPWAYSVHRHKTLRKFAVVKPGVLYRSGQLTETGLKRVIHDYGIKTVITLRDARSDGDAPPDIAEEQYCRENEILYVRISPNSWWPRDEIEESATMDGISQFREVMNDSNNYPVLVHCYAGIHRTGVMCAVYRMEHDGWSNEQAMKEMQDFGYFELNETPDLRHFLENYQPISSQN